MLQKSCTEVRVSAVELVSTQTLHKVQQQIPTMGRRQISLHLSPHDLDVLHLCTCCGIYEVHEFINCQVRPSVLL